jgi:HD-GYP domain-containing protein (c-di-GMP phosphodiesterase class II)
MHQYRLESSGRLIFSGANPEADSILGLNHADLVGKTIEEAFPGLANTEIPEIYRSVAREGTPWQTDQVFNQYGQIGYAFQVHAFQTSPGAMAVVFQDVRARQQMVLSLKKRDAILSAVAFAAERFLGNGDWKLKIQAVLTRLGEATEASRFYLCENQLTPKGETQANRLFEWQDKTLNQGSCEPWLINFNFEAQHFTRWLTALSRGEVIHGLVADFPEPERTLLAANNIQTIAVAPIHVDQNWWGIIGFDDCKHARVLSSAEVDALETAANTIGAAIHRTAADFRVRQKTARVQAMLKAGARLNAELDPQAVATAVCSEAAQALSAKTASVYLYDDKKQLLECAGGYQVPDQCTEVLPPVTLPTLNLHLHKWGIPLYLRDERDILHFFSAPIHNILDIRTVVVWLLLYDQKLIGILNLAYADATRILDAEELELLEGLCNQAVLAFNNARLYAQEQKRSRYITSLYELSVSLNSAQSTLETLTRTLSNVQTLLEADAGLAILPDEQKSLLTIPEANGYLAENRGWATSLNESWFETIAGNFDPYTARDLTKEDTTLKNLEGMEQTGPAVFIPLLCAHKPTGLLMVTRQKSPHTQSFSKLDLPLLSTISELVGTAVQKNLFYEDSQRRLTFLQALRAIDIEISSSLDLTATLQVVLDEVLSQLHVEAVDILVNDLATSQLKLTAARGFQNLKLLESSLGRGDHYTDQAIQEKRMIVLPDVRGKQTRFDFSELFLNEGFVAYAAVPLFSKGKIQGVMEVYHRRPLPMDQEWLEFLETLSGQAAIAIENITLFNNLQQTNLDLLQAYDATIEGWSTALDLKDADTEGHTQRVSQMTVLLANALGLGETEQVHVRRGAMLHDIGKMGVPDQILRKPGPLDEEEWVIMKKHPVYAYQWLSPAEYLRPALDIPYCHHERWDGQGYPRGLKGEDIPLTARIFSVIDVWDALSSDRPYRSRWPQQKVIHYLREQSGVSFDPQIMPVFLDILNDQELVM